MYRQRRDFLSLLFEQVLCQDAPILRWRYNDLPRWQCPVFETPLWRTHEIRVVQHWTSHRGLAPYVFTEQGLRNMLQNALRDQLTSFLQTSRFTAQPVMLPLLSRPPQLLHDTALPSSMYLPFWPPTPRQASSFPPAVFSCRAASVPRIVQSEDYPNLEKIRQRGQGQIPFQVFLYFWIGQPTHVSEAMWPCTFAELQSRNPRDLKFWNSSQNLANKHSKARLVLDIIVSASTLAPAVTVQAVIDHIQSCGRGASAWSASLAKSVKQLDTDVVPGNTDWDALLAGKRENLAHRGHRKKRTTVAPTT